MRTIVFLILAFNLIIISGFAQFELKLKLGLPDTLTLDNVNWVDANNDSLLDITVFSHSVSNEVIILLYQNVLANEMEYAGHIATGMKQVTYTFTDINSDNQVDIIASGELNSQAVTTAFINTGGFIFEQLSTPLLLRRGTKIIMDDLNMDGKKELIISGNDLNGSFLTVYQENSSSWVTVYDSVKIEATEIFIEDYNQDMYKDIFLKGKRNDLSSYAVILFSSGNFEFDEAKEIPVTEETAIAQGDFNTDGSYDFFIVRNSSEQQFLMSQLTRTHTLQDSIVTPFLPLKIFIADFNSDGKVDIQYEGFNNGTNHNEIRYTDSNEFSIYLQDMKDQSFGDYDRDGDLDLLQATADSIFVCTNTTVQKNEIPDKPVRPVGYFVFDRLFIYWEKSIDDHTPSEALTYDLALQSNEGDILMGDFDLFTNKRTLVSHGNNGAHNLTLLKGIQGKQFNFFIQAVDNSFHAGLPVGGSCTSSPCQSEVILVPTCGVEKTILEEENPEALWFSFNKGFLGKGMSIELPKPNNDTIFSFIPTINGCGALKIYQLKYEENLIKKDSTTQFVCEGATLNLSVEDNWETIEWTSDKHGFLSAEGNIIYSVMDSDKITVKLTDGAGCIIERITSIGISKPVLFLSADKYQIMKGESVQLHAEGGDSYIWTPSSGLNKTHIADPVANPTVTTQYTVTLSDTIGCKITGAVLVKVENSAFVPTLFTPNNDGINDFLKVYGLSSVESFKFSLYNREGVIVYASENPQEVITTGWNGEYKGVLQPAGVYQWKVTGKYPDGKKVLLNGKQSGSLVLLR